MRETTGRMEKRAGMRWCDRAGGARTRPNGDRGERARGARRAAGISNTSAIAEGCQDERSSARRDRGWGFGARASSRSRERFEVGRGGGIAGRSGSETHRAHVHQPPEALVALGEVGIPEGGLQRVLLLRHLQPRLLVLPVAAAALRLALAATSLAVHVTLGPAGGVAAEGGLTTHGGRQARLAVPGCVSPLGASRARAHTRARSRDFAEDDARPPSRPYPDVCLSNARRRVHGVGAIRSGCARRSGVFPVAFLNCFRLGCCSSIAPRVTRRDGSCILVSKPKKMNGIMSPRLPRPLSLPGGQDILRELGEIERASLLILR